MKRLLSFLKHVKYSSIITLISFLSLQSIEISAQTTKVLFIGSSLTGRNNLPNMFGELAAAAGKDVLSVSGARGGTNLTEHLAVQETLDKINQEDWDFVILENGDYHLMSPSTRAEVYTAVDEMKNLIFNNNSATKIIFFMDWAMQNGVYQDQTLYSYEEYQQVIYNATLEIAQSKDMLVAPIGSVWREVFTNRPDLEIFAIDGGHPSAIGSYLGACVYFSVIFEESSEGNSYFVDSVNEQDALYIQATASTTVLENMELWNLITSVEYHTEKINTSFNLRQNYPNPFNPSTTIEFELKETSAVHLEIFDCLGRKVNILIDNLELSPGIHSNRWNGKDSNGKKLCSGIYFYALRSGESVISKSMVLLK